MIDRMPAFVGYVTLAVGAALLTAPRLVTGPLGLDDQDAAYLHRAAQRSASAGVLKAGAAVMLCLAVVDGATALALRRS